MNWIGRLWDMLCAFFIILLYCAFRIFYLFWYCVNFFLSNIFMFYILFTLYFFLFFNVFLYIYIFLFFEFFFILYSAVWVWCVGGLIIFSHILWSDRVICIGGGRVASDLDLRVIGMCFCYLICWYKVWIQLGSVKELELQCFIMFILPNGKFFTWEDISSGY